MKMPTIVCAVTALALSLGSAAFAQGNDDPQHILKLPRQPAYGGPVDQRGEVRGSDGRVVQGPAREQDRRGEANRGRYDGREQGNGRGPYGNGRGDDGRWHGVDSAEDRVGVDSGRSDYRRGDDRMRGGRGAGPDHVFYPGSRLPYEYRSRQYVVDDWRGHYLSAPPRGYCWVQTGADYVLVAIATGVIVQVLLGN